MKPQTPRPRRLKDYRPPAYLVDHVDLDVAQAEARRLARQQADHPSLSDLSDFGEDREALAAQLRAAVENEIWRKPRR